MKLMTIITLPAVGRCPTKLEPELVIEFLTTSAVGGVAFKAPLRDNCNYDS